MQNKFYQKHFFLMAIFLGLLFVNLKAQIRISAANYPGIVEFSGSQNSTNGLIYEVLPGPAVINPAMNPTPFSDNISMTSGSYSITVSDVVDVDSPDSEDAVTDVSILFTGNNGQQYKIDNINIIHKPDGAGDHTFYGGVGLNKVMHGNSGIGIGLMPKMMAYITLWGVVDLKDAVMDTVIASNRIIHMMVATNVRDGALMMDTTVVGDGSDYNIRNAQTHIILPPQDMAGNMSPIPGTDHGFIHMMFEQSILENANKDWTKVYEVLPGPAAMNLALNPTPFSDRISIGAGSYSIGVMDIDEVDSPESKDSVIAVDIRFERPNGDIFVIDKINIIHKPDGAGDHTFYGGVGYDKLMHGNTGIGIGLMPKMTSYITLWGITDLKDENGNVLASNRVIHMMTASRVRRANLTMIPSAEIDSSDYDATKRETHVILPPQDMAGNMSPVPGTGHGFLHLMYENVSLLDSTVTAVVEVSDVDVQVKTYPNPFKRVTTIEYKLEHKSEVIIKVYNAQGKVVKNLANETQLPGIYKVKFDAGENLPVGVYFYTVDIGGIRTSGKLSLVD